MTKQEVATSVAKKIDIDHRQAVKAVEAVMETIMDAVSGGDEVTLRGFGTFKTVIRRAKKARDISRRETIMIPEAKKPVFKPCKNFVSRVRK